MATILNRRLIANTLTVVAVGGLGTYAASAYLSNKTAFAESPAANIMAQPTKIFGRGPAFKYLKLHSEESVNHNTKKLRFELPGGEGAVSGLSLTCALLTFSKPDGSWTPVVRPYTPVSKIDEPGFVDLLVKKYPGGKASTHLHSLKPGDSLLFLASLPGFSWTPNKFKHVYLIAGGAGITPIYQLTQGILDNPADKTKITVVFGVNTEEDLLFRGEFDEYKKRFPGRLDVHYTVSRPEEGFKDGQGVRSGYVDRELLGSVMQGPDETDAKVFVCGPPAMETALDGKGGFGNGSFEKFGQGKGGILGQLGYGNDRIHRF
ncbi:cytochrome b5 reductase family protein [Aspergillus undulatus]|uniref:cytochrome b5 reductase family protein n=1 Tax=Aspergillus undulatus TaxID=1810928 RepID=UPI003CCD5DCD